MRRSAHGGGTRRLVGWPVVACVCFVVACVGLSIAQKPPASEHEVKAAWLLNFARYVDWPSNAFSSPEAPLVIAVVGQDPFCLTLERILSNKVVKGRRFSLKRLAADDSLQGCHVVYL